MHHCTAGGKSPPKHRAHTACFDRVRTLTGKEIELDIEPDYKVKTPGDCTPPPHGNTRCRTWQHHILCMTGECYWRDGNRYLSSDTDSSCNQVSRIKERVEEKEGIPPVQQRLIFGGKQMYVPLGETRYKLQLILSSPGRTTRRPQNTTSRAEPRSIWCSPCVVDARCNRLFVLFKIPLFSAIRFELRIVHGVRHQAIS